MGLLNNIEEPLIFLNFIEHLFSLSVQNVRGESRFNVWWKALLDVVAWHQIPFFFIKNDGFITLVYHGARCWLCVVILVSLISNIYEMLVKISVSPSSDLSYTEIIECGRHHVPPCAESSSNSSSYSILKPFLSESTFCSCVICCLHFVL